MSEKVPVLEKDSIDIDLNGGLDESKPEEAIDWSKSFSDVQNLVSEGGQYILRNGLSALPTADSDSVTTAPIHRLVELEDGVGAVVKDYKLVHLNEYLQTLNNKGRLPEFGVQTKAAGSTAPPLTTAAEAIGTSATGVVGVGIVNTYHAIAYIGEAPTIFDPAAGDIINYTVFYLDIIDPNSNNVIKAYTYTAGGASRRYTMVAVDQRYLHIFESDTSATTKPRMFVIDSQSLPAGPTLSPSWTEFTSSANGDPVVGVCTITNASVAIISSSSTNRIEKFNNSGASVSSAAVTGFTTMSGIDTDGTNFYISGRLLGFSDPGVGLTLAGWYKASYTASPWVTSEGGTNMTEATNPPATGAAVNGLTPASFDNTNDKLSNTTNINTTAYTIVALVNATSAASKQIVGGALEADRPALKMTTNSGYVFTHTQTGGTIKSLNVPFPVARWAMVVMRFDGSTISMKVNKGEWISTDAGTLISSNALRLGSTTGCNAQILEVISVASALTNANIEDIFDYLQTRYNLTL